MATSGRRVGQPGRRRLATAAAAGALAALLAACGGGTRGNVARSDGRPAWIDEPGDGVSAAAGEHIRGPVAQEELAIARARDELARRLGVRVSNQMSTELRVAGQNAVSSSQSVSTQSVSGTEVSASLRAKWRDPSSGMLWVWLVPTK